MINYLASPSTVAKYSNVPKEYKIMVVYICDFAMVCNLFFRLPLKSHLGAIGGAALNLCRCNFSLLCFCCLVNSYISNILKLLGMGENLLNLVYFYHVFLLSPLERLREFEKI